MPPHRIWSEVGEDVKIKASEKHSLRMTAVLTVRADGSKLTILFIVKAEESETIARTELLSYPSGRVYVAHKNASIAGRVWSTYLRELARFEVTRPSVFLLDNLDCHGFDESESIMAGELHSKLCPLPPNSMSVYQPLDVGVMGPFKQMLRAAWLQEPVEVGLSTSEKRLKLIKRAIKVWKAFPESVVRNSFGKALPHALI